MKSWNQLYGLAKHVETKLRTAHGTTAELVDVEEDSPLITITMGDGLGPIDGDRVLRAALAGALGEIRRRGA
jgi:hypothetical protein